MSRSRFFVQLCSGLMVALLPSALFANGATISWDLEAKRPQTPNAEQAAQLAEEFAAWMDAKLSGDSKFAGTPSSQVKVETLGNGIKKARLPFHLMNASMVEVDGDGHFAGTCQEVHQVQGPGESHTPVKTPGGGVEGLIRVNNERLQGTDSAGRSLLYTPNPLQQGSSLSHWDTSATPNLLMEPSINSDLAFLDLDLTPSLMQDVGWTAGTSTFNIINLDPEGVGFTDPSPFDGAPNNPATTLGEARINLFNAVLSAWADTLESPVEIDIEVTWTPLFCQEGAGAVLGAASTTFIFQNDDFPFPNTWYHSALAEALAGADLTGDADGDIIVFLNSSIDEGCLAPGSGWYYGLDGLNPQNQIDLAPTVLHELGHGLGFANFTNETTGELINDTPGVYDHFTLDTSTGKNWAEMTNGERVTSGVNTGHVVWTGPNVMANSGDFLDAGVPELVVSTPADAAGTYDIGTASFGPPLPDAGLAGEIACMTDGTDIDAVDSPFDGCSPATNPEELAGKIALINRGACAFTTKVQNAEAAGAVGAIIVNTAGNSAISLGGDPAASVNIPSVGIGFDDGTRLRQSACGEVFTLLNEGRFLVDVQWATAQGSAAAAGYRLTEDTGYFAFFDPDNIEIVVKVIDACELDGFNNYWVFVAGLTNVEVTITVTDTRTGLSKTYFNPLSQVFEAIQDTEAFDTCF